MKEQDRENEEVRSNGEVLCPLGRVCNKGTTGQRVRVIAERNGQLGTDRRKENMDGVVYTIAVQIQIRLGDGGVGVARLSEDNGEAAEQVNVS